MSTPEQMLGMSLDDIIKLGSQKKHAAKPAGKGQLAQRPAGGRGGRGGAQAGRGGASAGRGAGRGNGQPAPRTVALTVKRGGVTKARGNLSTRPVRTFEPIIRVSRGAGAPISPSQRSPGPRAAAGAPRGARRGDRPPQPLRRACRGARAAPAFPLPVVC
jgi:hypothetical protein